MAVLSAVSIAEIKARGSIKDADVLKVRRNYYDDGIITAEEAEAILALNDACPVQDPAWADCFVETITDYIVEQAKPEGYLTTENCDWLIARISRDGRIETKTELELLVNVLDKARWAPQSLIRFALDQVKIAVLEGTGPLRSGKQLSPGHVCEGDVDVLRRMLYSFGGDGNIAVTRPEAEVLFDINDATADADNHPAWTDLFVKAIANSVMAASGYACPPREVALAREAWLDRRGDLSLAQYARRHGGRHEGPVCGLSPPERGGARHRPAHLAEDRHRHARGDHAGGGAVAGGAHGRRRQAHAQRARLAVLHPGGEPGHRSGAADAGG